ncbi:hypothetical protein ACWDR3_41915 [Streptomyces sp. NPDC001002]
MALRKILAVALTSLAVVGAGLTIPASAAPTAPSSLAECRPGYGCLYKGWSWDSHPFTYYYYGYYNLSGVSGRWRFYNNQTGGATMWLCMRVNGANCPEAWKLDPGDTLDMDNSQDVKSIKLAP